ncbi:MAG: hypothetical protein SFV55_25950 [Haliscomenobacter sp.]|uniref:hypothetical protein n=1 Tax=Haliscomenobacter sp. TaxID=2717303 RepID=UPI0029A35FD0|nr:hypothetical protein [Haliscomenobacter sp.]MDX2071904.1 hypothetical protein [Haliscomenobacter sp.]
MKYTPRQLTYAQYLLRRIGFRAPKDIDQYLHQLMLSKGRYHFNPKAKNPFKAWQFSAKAAVDALVTELELKKVPEKIPLQQAASPHFTATQLARYSFCPAAFSISNTFETMEEPGKALMVVGEQLHESLRLSRQKQKSETTTDPFYRRAWQNPAIGKILRAETIYAGHATDAPLFSNEKTAFLGSPDYIFRDREGTYFVVEEKFIHYRDPMNPSAIKLNREEWVGTLAAKNLERRQEWEKIPFYFFKNHLLQVLAYLVNICDYPLEYGYLVYWLYDFKDGETYVHKAGVKKLSLDPKNLELYNHHLDRFQQFVQQGVEPFQVESVNIKKCAACSQSPYCIHKTRRFDEVRFPYRKEDIKLYPTEFPGDLRQHY